MIPSLLLVLWLWAMVGLVHYQTWFNMDPRHSRFSKRTLRFLWGPGFWIASIWTSIMWGQFHWADAF